MQDVLLQALVMHSADALSQAEREWMQRSNDGTLPALCLADQLAYGSHPTCVPAESSSQLTSDAKSDSPVMHGNEQMWQAALQLDLLVDADRLDGHDASTCSKSSWSTRHKQHSRDVPPAAWSIQGTLTQADAALLSEVHAACLRMGRDAPAVCIGQV